MLQNWRLTFEHGCAASVTMSSQSSSSSQDDNLETKQQNIVHQELGASQQVQEDTRQGSDGDEEAGEQDLLAGRTSNRRGGNAVSKSRLRAGKRLRARKSWAGLSVEGKRKRLYRESLNARKVVNPLNSPPVGVEIVEDTDIPSPLKDPVEDPVDEIDSPIILITTANSLNSSLFTPNINFEVTEHLKENLNKIITTFSIAREPANCLLTLFNPFFPNLPKDARTLRQTPTDIVLRDVMPGKYVHIGVEANLRLFLQQVPNQPQVIVMDVFADGVAFHKLSKTNNYWVILGRFERSKNVFCIGAYNGKSSPDSYNDLLKDLIDECLKLQDEGIVFNSKAHRIKVRNFIGDSIAQSDLAYIKGPAGKNSCPYCKIVGLTNERRVTFCQFYCEARTDMEYRERADELHHREGVSDLFTKVLQFPSNSPIDYMHNVLLGACKRFFNFVFGKGGPRGIKGCLPINEIQAIQKHIDLINNHVPTEIHHACRNLREFPVYKAADYRVLLLKIGPTILKNLSHPDIYEAFLKLYTAITLLCDPDDCLPHNDLAKDLLHEFIEDCAGLFGDHFVVSVVHRLTHLPDMVKQQGQPLDFFSAFPFESFIAKVKKDMHSSRNVLHQIYNRRVESIKACNDYFIDSNLEKSAISLGKELKDIANSFVSARYNGFLIRVSSLRDSFLLTKLNEVVMCESIIRQGEEVIFSCKKLRKLPDFFTAPLRASKMSYFHCERNFDPSSETLALDIHSFARKMFFIPLNDETCTLAPLRKFVH